MLSVAKLTLTRNDKPNRHAYHDVGLAVSQLALQATAAGLSIHQMGGFDVAKAREIYGVPSDFDPVAAIAIGYSDEEPKPSRSRRPQDELAFHRKWGDGFCPMGPYVLTADEIEDVQNLDVELKINDEVRQSANTSQMIHSVPEMIAVLEGPTER